MLITALSDMKAQALFASSNEVCEEAPPGLLSLQNECTSSGLASLVQCLVQPYAIHILSHQKLYDREILPPAKPPY